MNAMIESKPNGRTRGKPLKSLVARVGLLLALLVPVMGLGQTYSVLHDFTGIAGGDGSHPMAGLVASGNVLYGTTYWGGNFDDGTVFKLSTTGSDYLVLKHLQASLSYSAPIHPATAVVLQGNSLFGTTLHSVEGQGWGGGVFRVNTDGSGYNALCVLTNVSGTCLPWAELVVSGDTLYGTTEGDGTYEFGSVFTLRTDGSGFSFLKRFSGGNDGRGPMAGLVLAGTRLYGTTAAGGTSSYGTVFTLNTDGTDYTVLKSFGRPDGRAPSGTLLLVDGTLYGTAQYGGNFDCGTVFRLNTDGSGFTVLKEFNGTDGISPRGGLILYGATLYGTTYGGYSPSELGTVFRIDTNGTGFKVLKYFGQLGAGTDAQLGSKPSPGLVLSGTTMFGTTEFGGTSNLGVVFSLAMAPTAAVGSRTAEAGSLVRFSPQANGAPFLTYAWFFNDTNLLSVSAEPDLQIPNVQDFHSGLYTVVVSNDFGAVTSAPAMLNVIPAVDHRPAQGLLATAEVGSVVNVQSADTLYPVVNWFPVDTFTIASSPQWCFDLARPLPSQRFYRASQSGTPGIQPSLKVMGLVPAVTVTGEVGGQVRVDGINQFGPVDAWFTLATVTLTNTSQFYFDLSASGQPARLYRVVPLP